MNNIQIAAGPHVACRCPDGRSGNVDRCRAILAQLENFRVRAIAVLHGPGTDCGGPGTLTSWAERDFDTFDLAREWLQAKLARVRAGDPDPLAEENYP